MRYNVLCMFSELQLSPLARLRDNLRLVIKGRDDTIDFILTGLVAGGHVLIEDYPGSGKTTLAKALGKSIDCSKSPLAHIAAFRRIQFTPDLLPSDILGITIFDGKSGNFSFQQGPIFSHIVLADEINRTGPKVQAAFLECLAERQITIESTTHPLDKLFFVLATQNPLDVAGTYPLPLVQLDRFLLKVPMQYVSESWEIEIIAGSDQIEEKLNSLAPVITREEILELQRLREEVEVAPEIIKIIARILQESRKYPAFQFGASTRAGVMFRKALQAWAIIQNRSFVTDTDVKTLAPYLLLHRLKTNQQMRNDMEVFQEFLLPFVEELVRMKK
jgi:MoxR-like ATPase